MGEVLHLTPPRQMAFLWPKELSGSRYHRIKLGRYLRPHEKHELRRKARSLGVPRFNLVSDQSDGMDHLLFSGKGDALCFSAFIRLVVLSLRMDVRIMEKDSDPRPLGTSTQMPRGSATNDNIVLLGDHHGLPARCA